ncbi:MAG: ATP-binding protein [Verrucomicrobia bacterium]|nr:ATP-binding protein [Verrucomicrobiota bacterium]
MSQTVDIVLKNDLGELERLNQLVEEFGGQAGLHVEEQYALFLCLEEIVTNIVNYAWPDGGEHDFSIHIAVDDEHIKVQFEDDGVPFDPTKYPEPDMSKPASQRPVGGLGIHLVRQSTNELWYQHRDGKNVFIIKKKRKKAA